VDFISSLIETTNKAIVSSGTKRPEFVSETWIPLLGELARIAQSEPVSSATRKRALALLLRACLNVGQDKLNREEWANVVELVVFPACNFSLRDGETGPSSPLLKGGETKSMIAACELLAKIVLVHSVTLSKLEKFSELWIEVLQFMERFKQTGMVRASGGEPEGNALSEIVTELLKNLLLSMSAEGILSPVARVIATGQPLTQEESASIAPPSAPSSLLWEMSWAILDRSPGLRSELYPLNDEIDLRETPIPQEMMATEGAQDQPEELQDGKEPNEPMDQQQIPDEDVSNVESEAENVREPDIIEEQLDEAEEVEAAAVEEELSTAVEVDEGQHATAVVEQDSNDVDQPGATTAVVEQDSIDVDQPGATKAEEHDSNDADEPEEQDYDEEEDDEDKEDAVLVSSEDVPDVNEAGDGIMEEEEQPSPITTPPRRVKDSKVD
jgi:hypothetical protein